MHNISFIITTYNISPYIEKCLQSASEVALPGDQVIIVDDGSDDGTDDIVRTFLAKSYFADQVEVKTVFLGANTMGGVGIGANIGLSEATRDTVFFIDGDDWLNTEGFKQTRAYWNMQRLDILFTNYQVYDEKKDSYQKPADNARWNSLNKSLSFDDLQKAALAFIAVPWRKFYNRDFIEKNKLRFPEGDFFFEDNPFHWDVCLSAKKIGFINRVSCYHRVNRPGQTMASTGMELDAFFTHFKTILQKQANKRDDIQFLATEWLLNNMSWHVDRLSEEAFYHYANKANIALKMVDDEIWTQRLAKSSASKRIWIVANRLRDGKVWEQVADWKFDQSHKLMKDINRKIDQLNSTSDEALNILNGQKAAATFESIKRQLEENSSDAPH